MNMNMIVRLQTPIHTYGHHCTEKNTTDQIVSHSSYVEKVGPGFVSKEWSLVVRQGQLKGLRQLYCTRWRWMVIEARAFSIWPPIPKSSPLPNKWWIWAQRRCQSPKLLWWKYVKLFSSFNFSFAKVVEHQFDCWLLLLRVLGLLVSTAVCGGGDRILLWPICLHCGS